MKRLGLVGVGAWGRRVIDTIGARADCRVAAFARASARADLSIDGATACTDWRELVRRAEQGELDGVIAATTPPHQAEVARECATAGVALLVEKPLGFSASDVERISAAFERSPRKAPLVVDYIHLWAPAYGELKRRVEACGGRSRVAAISAEGCKLGPLRGWSSLYDYAPHELALSLDLLGVEAKFDLRSAKRLPGAAPQHELYDVRFELDGVPVHICVGNGAETRVRRFAVQRRDGAELVYDDTQPHASKLTDGGVPVAIDRGLPLDAVIGHFLHLIDAFHAGRLATEAARAGLFLSARINAMLDAITAKLAVDA
jgi:predicted dehydrogenase